MLLKLRIWHKVLVQEPADSKFETKSLVLWEKLGRN